MKLFSQLFQQLDSTSSTNKKISAMADYFHQADTKDTAWAIYLLSGRRLKRLVNRSLLQEWLAETSQYPLWMIKEAYTTVGDFAETVALLAEQETTKTHGTTESSETVNSECREAPETDLKGNDRYVIEAKNSDYNNLLDRSLSDWMENHIRPLNYLSEAEKKEHITAWWTTLPYESCFLVTKLITGALRVGVSHTLVARAISQYSGIAKDVILHRLMGDWHPTEEFTSRLIDPNTDYEDHSRPYPFYLASPIKEPVQELGDINDWFSEWKWDGIRAQVIKREGQVYIWTRGEELVTERFPEIASAATSLPDGTVIDGEILPYKNEKVLSFNQLQKRLGRKTLPKKLLLEIPVVLFTYDCIEYGANDIRSLPLHERRNKLNGLLDDYYSGHSGVLLRSPIVEAKDWETLLKMRTESRDRGVEGFMLKHKMAPYETGRKRGNWWKWKIDPLTIDAVMIYAQAGHGRRATLFTDYTFAVWEGDQLLPLAKAYSGLDDKEINKLDRWIRSNTNERFGPVRSVTPEHVFEIAFEGINYSKRHKSGVALRFPRIARWRTDLSIKDADTLSQVKELLIQNKP